MSLVKGVNSLALPSEGDEYFSTRVDSEAWLTANYARKAAALVTGTGIFDELLWIGVAVSDTQLTAFPRKGSYFDPRLGMTVTLDGTFTPKRVMTALFELSLHLLNNEDLLNDTGSIETLKLSGIELKEIKSVATLPAAIKRIVRPLLENRGAASWWRAN
jgi:hypothetical protein